MTDNNTPTCYPYLYGYLQQVLKCLHFDLVNEGIVDHDKQDKLVKYIDEKIKNAHKAERELPKQ